MIRAMTALALLLAASGCGGTPANNGAAPVPANSVAANNQAVAAPAPPPANTANAANTSAPLNTARPPASEGCAGEIGLAGAQELVDQCRTVSSATRPPCNVSNQCALIEDEILRGCEALGEDAPEFCGEL